MTSTSLSSSMGSLIRRLATSPRSALVSTVSFDGNFVFAKIQLYLMLVAVSALDFPNSDVEVDIQVSTNRR